MNMRHPALLILAVWLILVACSTQRLSEHSQSSLANIQALLPGDYIGTTSRGKVYHSIVQLQVPDFGGDIFYHHISTESLRGPATQRKIYLFDDSGQQMRSTVLLGRGEAFTDNQTMARKLNKLTKEQLLRFPDGCQFQWASAADGFVAKVRRSKCSYESPAFGEIVSPEMVYQLNRCSLAISEGIFREDGSPVFQPSISDNRRVDPEANGSRDSIKGTSFQTTC